MIEEVASPLRRLLCRLGLHPRSRSIRYLGIAINRRRNWLGMLIYKAFLDTYQCPSCGRVYNRWT